MEKSADCEEADESPKEKDMTVYSPKLTRCSKSDLLEKFQKLKRRRQEIIAKSSLKRIKQMQTSVTEKVAEEFKKTDDLDVLVSHQVQLPPEVLNGNETVLPDTDGGKHMSQGDDSASSCSQTADTLSNKAQSWMDFKPFLDVNAHLQHSSRDIYRPKTKLEKQIDKAIEHGDFSTAEELSDHLAVRELGTKVVDAIDAKRYADRKKREKELLKAKQKKKLNWWLMRMISEATLA
ncbi:hypothetical protein LSH36_138g01039 [Paralvinella palmiformis]|uniref:Protein FAM204A n=1 Tax=Paralvinella palmiformis TaxID=53620 RepID=A0AAD9N9A8_9ANNE|nr:hypothetical protein LSH36_138g01039 [Paralvinella palmiformis]